MFGGIVAMAGVLACTTVAWSAPAGMDEPPEDQKAQERAPLVRPVTPPKGVTIPQYEMFRVPMPMIIRSTIREATGRLDKMAFDPIRYRVFVSAINSNSVFVLDLATHRTPHIIQNLPEPRDVMWLPEEDRLIVACGGDGTVRTFKTHDLRGVENNPAYTPEHTVQLTGEATDLALEPAERGGRLWVAHAMMLSAVDLKEGKRVARVALPGRPDGVVFVETPAGPRVFANVPRPEPTEERPEQRPMVVAVDPVKGEIVERWVVSEAAGNTAIGANATGDRLFVVTQSPPRLIVMDSVSGREVARLEAPADADSVMFDGALNRAYVTGGGAGGSIAVVQAERGTGGEGGSSAGERYTVVHTERTNVGGRNGVLAGPERLLMVAIPAFGTEPTYVYVYMIGAR